MSIASAQPLDSFSDGQAEEWSNAQDQSGGAQSASVTSSFGYDDSYSYELTSAGDDEGDNARWQRSLTSTASAGNNYSAFIYTPENDAAVLNFDSDNDPSSNGFGSGYLDVGYSDGGFFVNGDDCSGVNGQGLESSKWYMFKVTVNSNSIDAFVYYPNGTLIDSLKNVGCSVSYDYTDIGVGIRDLDSNADSSYFDLVTYDDYNYVFNENPSINSVSTSPSSWTVGEAVDFSYSASDSDGTIQEVKLEVFNATSGTQLKQETFTYSSSSVSDTQMDWFTPSSAGNYTVYFTATDDAGESSVQTLEKQAQSTDTTPPSITVHQPVQDEVYDPSVPISISASETVDTWKYSLDGGTNNTFTPNITLNGVANGSHSITVYANDSSGNTGSSSVDFLVDDTKPSISFNPSTTASGTQSTDWVFVNVTATDNENLTSVTEEFDGTNSSFNTNNGDYYWTNHTSLSDGSYTFQAFAEDNAGNINSTESRTVTIDSTAPTLTVDSPENITYDESSVELNVTSSEAANYTYNVDGSSNTTVNEDDKDLNTTLTGLSDGSHTVNVYATDSAGNTGFNSQTFTVDTASGYIQINSSVQINQSANNAYINVTDTLNVSSLKVFSDATQFGGINWSVNGDSAGRIDVKLSHFSDENLDDSYLANYSIAEGLGNSITSSFQPVEVDSVYQITKNGTFFKQIQSDVNSLADFGYEVVDTAYTSFTVKRTDQFRPEINSTTYELDQVNGNERLNFVLWARNNSNDIASSTGPGTRIEFTNTSMVYDVSLPLTGTYSVTDFAGLTRNRQIDVSKTDSGVTEDPGYSNTLDSQKRVQELNITNGDTPPVNYTWNSSLGQDFTGQVGRGSTVSESASSTGDFIENNSYGFSVDTSEVVLGFNYSAHWPLELNNTVSNEFTGISTANGYPSVTQCSTINNTAVDIAGNTFKNFSIGQTCNPGNIGNPSQTITNASGSADERIWYNSTDMTVYTNKTSETDIVIRADKSNLKNPDNRDSNSLKSIVEGVSSTGNNNLNVTDTGSFFRVTVGDIQNSTLYTDDTDWSVTYTLSGDNTTIIEDGGGGGGAAEPSTDDQTVYFGEVQTEDGLESFNVPFGETVTRNLSITNTVQEDLTVQLRRGNNPVCKYVSVRRTLNSDQFTQAGTYQVEGASINNLGTQQDEVVETTVRFNLPNQTVLENAGVTDYSCEFSTSSSYGVAEPLNMEIAQGFFKSNLGFLFEEFCFELPVGSVGSELTSVDTDSVSVCVPVWALLLLGVGVFVLVYWRLQN